MRKIFWTTILLCFFSLALQAQADSLQAQRYVIRATLYGIGHTNILDTYLSPMEYTGPEFRIQHENMRMTKLLNGNISRQSMFQANVSMANNQAGTSNEFIFLANWSLAYHYQHRIDEHFKILIGPYFDLNGGMIYNFRNSNNPIQAKAYANIGTSNMVIYRLHIKEIPFVFRYQLNIPLLGLMFSPQYGQPYYEMTISNDWDKNICFTSLHNQPSVRQYLTLDIPIKSNNLRLGYTCDIQQSKVNHLKSHIWSHTFMVGFVRNFYLLRGKNQIITPSSVNPY